MGKYYAVKVGRVPGIYTSWDKCEDQVKGFSGAKYKSFSTKLEAEAFLDLGKKSIEENSIEALRVFVDGSYSKHLKKAGFGCVFILNNEILMQISQPVPIDEKENLWNVSAEIAGVIFAVNWAIDNNYETLDINYDYEGLERWYTGEWKANKETTKKYVQTLKKLGNKIKLNFTKVKAHSGDEYNDLADQLAKNALDLNNEVIENNSVKSVDDSLITLTLNEYHEIVGDISKEKIKFKVKQYYINDAALIKIAKYFWKKEKRKISDLDFEAILDSENQIIYLELRDINISFNIKKIILLKGEKKRDD